MRISFAQTAASQFFTPCRCIVILQNLLLDSNMLCTHIITLRFVDK